MNINVVWMLVALSGFLISPMVAQGGDPRIDALITRTLAGDASARKTLGGIARGMATDAAQHRMSSAELRDVARVTLAMAAPISTPDRGVSAREVEWRGGAIRALRNALKADSGDSWSAMQLEQITPYPYLWYTASQELKQLRAVAARQSDLPKPLKITLLRLELEAGSPDSAAQWMTRLSGALPPVARGHLQADIAFALHDTAAGTAAYYRGASFIADSADLEWYGADLAWIATAKEMAEWRALPYGKDAHANWLHRFWNRKDLNDAQLPGSRLVEQFRRWHVALSSYRWDRDGSVSLGVPLAPDPSMPTKADIALIMATSVSDDDVSNLAKQNRLHPLSAVLDDRGGMILRHGEPVEKACGVCGTELNQDEAWKWFAPDGPFVIFFSSAGSARYGMIVRNAPTSTFAQAPEVCHLDARLCIPLSRNRTRILREEFTRMREVAENSDGNRLTFHDSLGAVMQAYGIANGGTLVVVAVPARGLVANVKALDTLRTFRLNLRAMVGDSAAGVIVGALDTAKSWRTPSSLDAASYLASYFIVPAPVGIWSVTVLLGDSAHRAGSAIRFTKVPVVRMDGQTFQMSDPILGREGELTWTHDGNVIPLNPTNAWRRTDAATLSYELDGLVPGHEYITATEIWSAKHNAKVAAVSMGSRSSATGIHEVVRRDVSLTALEPGDYRIIVRVRDVKTGVEISRSRNMAVRK